MLEEKNWDVKRSNISSKIININGLKLLIIKRLRVHKNNGMTLIEIKQNHWKKCWKEKKRDIRKMKT